MAFAVPGLIEIVGEPHSGRTACALELCRGISTVYISPVPFRHLEAGPTVWPFRIDSLCGLLNFVSHELLRFVVDQGAGCVIVDGLDQFLYAVSRPRALSGDVSRLGRMLKRFSYIHGISVIIINGAYSGWKVENYTIPNHYLGMGWCYLPNARFLITKDSSGKRSIIRLFGSVDLPFREFIITSSGIKTS